YGWGQPLPAPSSLTRIRQRLGLAIFQRFFERVVDLCQQAGLLWGRELFFDATKVRANAALNSVVPRFYLQAKEQTQEHLAALFADDPEEPPCIVAPSSASPEEGSAEAQEFCSPTRLPIALAAEAETAVAEENQAVWKLLDHRRLDPQRGSESSYQRQSDLRGSPTDPDAALMNDG